MADLPSGTVTFLLTDIVGSTVLQERDPEAMRRAVARHDALRTTIILPTHPTPLIGTLRRDYLGHLVIVDEQHLRAILAEVVRFQNAERPHRTLRLETPIPAYSTLSGPDPLASRTRGLHHAYERAA